MRMSQAAENLSTYTTPSPLTLQLILVAQEERNSLPTYLLLFPSLNLSPNVSFQPCSVQSQRYKPVCYSTGNRDLMAAFISSLFISTVSPFLDDKSPHHFQQIKETSLKMCQAITEPTLSIKQAHLLHFRSSLRLLSDVALPPNPKLFSVLNGKPSLWDSALQYQ